MKNIVALLVFSTIAALYSPAEARRGLGGNLGIVYCPLKAALISYPSIPSSYDLRQSWGQCMTPMMNQGNCGCCWAFAAAQTLTERFCIQSNNTVKRLLSPQHMIQCDKTCQDRLRNRNCNAGCSGGYLDNAWVFMRDTGVLGWSCMPYIAQDGTCPATKCNTSLATTYHAMGCYRLGSVRDIQAEILLNGPVEAGFTVYDDFPSYISGIYTVRSSTALGGHAVRLIGWGTENGVDFWIGANQWSSSWGENGYFRIRRGTNEAGIEATTIAGMADINSLPSLEYEEYTSDGVIVLPDSQIESPSQRSSAASVTASAIIASLLLLCALLLI